MRADWIGSIFKPLDRSVNPIHVLARDLLASDPVRSPIIRSNRLHSQSCFYSGSDVAISVKTSLHSTAKINKHNVSRSLAGLSYSYVILLSTWIQLPLEFYTLHIHYFYDWIQRVRHEILTYFYEDAWYGGSQIGLADVSCSMTEYSSSEVIHINT